MEVTVRVSPILIIENSIIGYSSFNVTSIFRKGIMKLKRLENWVTISE